MGNIISVSLQIMFSSTVSLSVTADPQFSRGHIRCISTSSWLAVQTCSQEPCRWPSSAHHSERRLVILTLSMSIACPIIALLLSQLSVMHPQQVAEALCSRVIHLATWPLSICQLTHIRVTWYLIIQWRDFHKTCHKYSPGE